MSDSDSNKSQELKITFDGQVINNSGEYPVLEPDQTTLFMFSGRDNAEFIMIDTENLARIMLTFPEIRKLVEETVKELNEIIQRLDTE